MAGRGLVDDGLRADRAVDPEDGVSLDPLDREAALRALLAVDPQSEPPDQPDAKRDREETDSPPAP